MQILQLAAKLQTFWTAAKLILRRLKHGLFHWYSRAAQHNRSHQSHAATLTPTQGMSVTTVLCLSCCQDIHRHSYTSLPRSKTMWQDSRKRSNKMWLFIRQFTSQVHLLSFRKLRGRLLVLVPFLSFFFVFSFLVLSFLFFVFFFCFFFAIWTVAVTCRDGGQREPFRKIQSTRIPTPLSPNSNCG